MSTTRLVIFVYYFVYYKESIHASVVDFASIHYGLLMLKVNA